MNKMLVTAIVALVTVLWNPDVGLCQTLQQGEALLKEGIEIKNRAKSQSDFQRSLSKLESSLKIFERVNSELGQGYALGFIGQLQNSLGQHSKALESLEKSLSICRRMGKPADEGVLLNEIAGTYISLCNYPKALDYSGKTLAVARRTNDLNTEGLALGRMGLAHLSLGEYDKALNYFGQSLGVFRRINDPKSEGSALNNMGMASQSLGQFDKALEYYEKSLEKKRNVSDPTGEASTLSNIGEIYRSRAQYPKALDNYERALAISKKVGDLGVELKILNNIGLTYYSWGQYAKALTYYEQSLALTQKTGDINSKSGTLNNMAGVHDARGQYDKALDFYGKALLAQRQIGDVKGESTTLNNMGLVYESLGRYAQSLECLEESLGIRSKIGDQKGQGITLGNIGKVHKNLGRYSDAQDYYQKSIDISKKVGDVRQLAITLNDMGTVFQSSGRYVTALGFYKQSLDITRNIKDPNQEAITLGQKGRLEAMMGEYGDAKESMKTAIRIQEKIGTPTSKTKDELAHIYLDAGDLGEADPLIRSTGYASTQGRLAFLREDYSLAAKFYEREIDSGEKTGNAESLFRGCTGLARSYEEVGNYTQAEELYRKALSLTEEIRSGLLPSERKDFFEVKIQGLTRLDPARGLTRIDLKLKRTDGGIETSELTKARTFSEHLAESFSVGHPGVPEDTLAQELQFVSRLASLKKGLAKTDRENQPEKHGTLSREAKIAEKNLDTFVEKLRKQHPTYAWAKYPRPVSLSQSALKSGEYVVMFDLLGEGVGIKLIHDKEIKKTVYSKYRQKDLEKDVTRFRDPLVKATKGKGSFDKFDVELAKSLYDRLLRETLAHVPNGAPVIIVPDGILSTLPFDALVTGGETRWKQGIKSHPYPGGVTFLVDEHPISYYQSITALTLFRSQGNKKLVDDKLLIIADPVFNLQDLRAQNAPEPQLTAIQKQNNMKLMATIEDESDGNLKFKRLPQTLALAQNLEKLYGADCKALTGLKANKADFLSKVAPEIYKYGNVIFATHGVMSTHVPGLKEPFLALTMAPPGTDGFLKMSDILSLKMNADVVALTACQSGLGKDVSGEGVMSMGRAFQYAGAKSVLMTLWDVEETSATKLTEKFFQYRKDGKSKLEALRSARDDVRNEGYGHPYFWSAFILVGET